MNINLKNNNEIIGFGEGLINQNSEEFKVLQNMIKSDSLQRSQSELIENQILSLRFQMESYLEKENPKELIPIGFFLKRMVEALKVKKKMFAKYIDYKESNLSAIFKGRRKINTDLAVKFGEIFNIKPSLWLHIQSKNELLEMLNDHKEKYKKYSLDDLLEMKY